MIKSAIVKNMHDSRLRYMYISFGAVCTKYNWYRNLSDVIPSVASLNGISGADTFMSWMKYTSIKYKIISIFANDDFTGELRIDDYPELLI